MSTKSPQRIVIVGGVAGGMSAATRARRLDENAEITVFEKGQYVGYANCGIPYALGGVIKEHASLILQTPESFKKRYNINVHLNSEVTAIDRAAKAVTVRTDEKEKETSFPYDTLILAQGAESMRLPFVGSHLPQVFTLQTIDDLKAVWKYIQLSSCGKAAVIGGGFIGLEAAENLHHLGLDVTIIELLPHAYPPADAEIAEPIHAEIRRHNINLLLNSRVEQIRSDDLTNGVVLSVTSDHPENRHSIEADVVLMCVGIRARTALAAAAGLEVGKTGVKVNEHMQTSDPDIYAVGDMVETTNLVTGINSMCALAGPANRQGRLAADNIFGKEISYRGNVGTSVCQVCNMTIASTGLSVEACRRLNMPLQWVTVHPSDHAGYYPGASHMTLRVVFEPDLGHILGAQAVGKKGIDKRIDVLSIAIQAGMTIYDLEHLELGYAPPYGSAKDPINMAGFVGSNVLHEEVKIMHPEELQKLMSSDSHWHARWTVLDLRNPKEFMHGHLPNAINIPVNNLRHNLDKLDKSRKLLVYCQVGYRGYLAYRILTQMGFDVVNLDGGFKSVTDGGYDIGHEDEPLVKV